MQADGWISAPALPLFSLLDFTVVLHWRQEASSRADFMAASVGIRQEAEEGCQERWGYLFTPSLLPSLVFQLFMFVGLYPSLISVCLRWLCSPLYIPLILSAFWLSMTMCFSAQELKLKFLCILEQLGYICFILINCSNIKQFLKMFQPCMKINLSTLNKLQIFSWSWSCVVGVGKTDGSLDASTDETVWGIVFLVITHSLTQTYRHLFAPSTHHLWIRGVLPETL